MNRIYEDFNLSRLEGIQSASEFITNCKEETIIILYIYHYIYIPLYVDGGNHGDLCCWTINVHVCLGVVCLKLVQNSARQPRSNLEVYKIMYKRGPKTEP